MQSEICTDCGIDTGTKKVNDNLNKLILLMDNNFRCKQHALNYLDQREKMLKNSTNLPTSITEQRLLDEVRVMKAKIK
ncbi:MAG: hypothetical protein VX982_05400 [Chloroflexota bacterium]|nr:hypothetical protein [Chloroflexota bacterium]